MLQDPIAQELQAHIDKSVRLQVGKQQYIGRVVSVSDSVIELVSGDNPVAVTLRTDVIDAVLAYVYDNGGDL
jgi:hypothetical protein